MRHLVLLAIGLIAFAHAAPGQVPPSTEEIARYAGLHAAAARGDAQEIDCRHDTIKGLVLRAEFVRKR